MSDAGHGEVSSPGGPAAAFAALVAGVAADLAASGDLLNQLDAVAGDGDLGVTVRVAAAALSELVPVIAPLELPDAVRRVGTELARRAPSTGGTLFAFALIAAGKALGAAPQASVASLAGTQAIALALGAAATSIAQRGRVALGDKTMLDALDPAARAVAAAAEAGESIATAVWAAAEAADAGAGATASMRATVGRAGWLVERSQGHEDAGARLVALAFAAAAHRLAGSHVA